ncbi:exodeoxyribonuclease VII large subunit [Pasteuria penetrans]|uniref:exodeoxyribonuclease VII large subunit n=1 Tax=Pasteuria penetrans TaxID=86005 RepID=UPI000F9AFE21|nr:exodeoxyribonuclease VII large subunit [Pasteuria penetrans]
METEKSKDMKERVLQRGGQDFPVLSVTEAVAQLSYCVAREERLQGIWLEGELSNLSHSRVAGHKYFTLKDCTAQIAAVFFMRYARWLKFPLAEGERVQAYGHMGFYEKVGRVQFVVHSIRKCGIGDLHTALQRLQARLEAEGLFTRPRQSLPTCPRCVGVVTSPTGAVIQDILTTLDKRWPMARVLLFPVNVQGDHALESVVQGLEVMGGHPEVEVLIVGRGGGSVEDLVVFNQEQVVRAIVKSSRPVVAAIGHATDTTLSDAVADAHAVTPTAAAALVVPDQQVCLQRIGACEDRLRKAVRSRQRVAGQRLQTLLASSVFLRPERRFVGVRGRWQGLLVRWQNSFPTHLRRMEYRVGSVCWRMTRQMVQRPQPLLSEVARRGLCLRQRMVRCLDGLQRRLQQAQVRLLACHPHRPLERGYAWVEQVEKPGQIQMDAGGLQPDALIRIRWARSSVVAKVKEIEAQGGVFVDGNQK